MMKFPLALIIAWFALKLLGVAHAESALAADEKSSPKSPESKPKRPTDAEFQKALQELEELRSKMKLELEPGMAVKDYVLLQLGVREGMRILVARWDDPRSEQILKQLADARPDDPAQESEWISGQAQQHLAELIAKRQCHLMLEDAASPEEKVRRIRQVFSEHSDWLDSKTRPVEKEAFVKELVLSAEKIAGGEVIDLLARAGLLKARQAQRYPEATIDYVRKLGLNEVMASHYGLLELVVQARMPSLKGLLREWLNTQATEEEEIHWLISAIGALPGGQEDLIMLLQDHRHSVIRWAASVLSIHFPDQKSMEAIQITLQKHSEKTDTPEELLDRLKFSINYMKAKIKEP